VYRILAMRSLDLWSATRGPRQGWGKRGKSANHRLASCAAMLRVFMAYPWFTTSLKVSCSEQAPTYDVRWTWIGGYQGVNHPGQYGALNETSASSVPSTRYLPAAWVGAHGLVHLLGGYGYGNTTFGHLNDFWMFSLSSFEWTWIGGSSEADESGHDGTFQVRSPNNIPGGRYGSAYWQTDVHHLWQYGGLGLDAYGYRGSRNDVWM